MRRTRLTIGVLLLGLGVLGMYLAALAQDAPWPPPVKPLPPGVVAPTVISPPTVPVRDIPDTPSTEKQDPNPANPPAPSLLPQDAPLPLEPGGEPKKSIENFPPAESATPVQVTVPDNQPPPAPVVEVREVEEPAPKPIPKESETTVPSPPMNPGNGPIRIGGNSGLPPKQFEAKSVPAAPVHTAVPIRRHVPAPVLPQEVITKSGTAPVISTPNSNPVVNIQSPLLTIEKKGPSLVTLGQPVHFEIIVRNVGMVAAQQVRVEDELPEKVRFLSGSPQPVFQGSRVVWVLDEVPAQGEQRLQLELEAGTSGEISGQTSLVLTIGSQTQVSAPPLEMSITGPGRAAKDSQAHFEIHLNNRSNRRLENLTLHVQLPAGLTHPMGNNIEAAVGELAPGASKNIDLKITAVQPGRHTLAARITAQERQEAAARASVFVGEPGLILLVPATTRIQMDRPGELTIEVANFHTRIVKNLSVTATLPEGVEFLGANEGGKYLPGMRKVQWLVDNLVPDQSQTLSVSVKGKIPGQYVHAVAAQAPEALKAQVQGKVVVEGGLAQLTMKIKSRDNVLEVGRETVFEIRVGNQGSSADSAVQILAAVPEGMMPKSADGPTGYRIQGQQVLFEPLARLDPNSQVVFHVSVAAQSPGDRRLRVQLTSSSMHEPVTREERTLVYKD